MRPARRDPSRRLRSWWWWKRRRRESYFEAASMDGVPEPGPVSGAGGRAPVRENLSCPDGVVPGSLGTESVGMVRGAHLPAGQADRLEAAAADDQGLLGGEPEPERSPRCGH